MKLGIMSMQRIENYGSFLQAYSLKKMLEELGHNVVFVDYVIEPCIVSDKSQEISPEKRSLIYRVIRKIYYLISDTFNKITGKKKEEIKFENSRLRNRYSDYLTELGITNNRNENFFVDTLIIGSDEVFNCLQTNPAVGYSKQLFGENVKSNKTITYAASAGHTTLKDLEIYGIKNEISHMLSKNFSSFSVRDHNTFSLVYELTGIKPMMHLDPVLVSNFSSEIIEKNDINDYVIVYSYEERMSNITAERDMIQNFAHERGLKTLSIGNYQSWTDLKKEASPFELLGYFKNAKYIITDTFHGTVFSIILNKNFATIIRESNSQKLGDLLSYFELEDRRIDSIENLENILLKNIDYDSINTILTNERKRSLEYLKKSI